MLTVLFASKAKTLSEDMESALHESSRPFAVYDNKMRPPWPRSPVSQNHEGSVSRGNHEEVDCRAPPLWGP
ncbi:hypothetical protein BX666DRAFT_2033873 [Dichotomocladium elegans]|nr:hypothetical protein BX666DRAFT_2033873 [Dichotomocladium elegans]